MYLQQQIIILFTRYPQAGKVKTRLMERLGPQGAADLHEEMTRQVIRNIEPVLQEDSIQLQVYYCGGSEQQMQTWLGHDRSFFLQQGENLGARMADAFGRAWRQGAGRVLLIGSDCPDIDAVVIRDGLERLRSHDVVLGPAVDGGYYLIGLRASVGQPACLFDGVDWGTGQVLQQTATLAEAAGLSCAFLRKLHDIDRPEDLVHFNHHSCSQ
jgi:rSAM/selenodomain-associated transferase 1